MIYPGAAEQVGMFENVKTLYHRNDPQSSKVAALKVRKFKKSHCDKIRALLKLHPDKTAKELAALSVGTEYEMTYIQIDRRAGEMPDVIRDETVKRDGCHPLRLV